MSVKRLKTVVLLSGGGRTLANLMDAVRDEGLPLEIDLVISSNPEAYGLTRAREYGLQTDVVPSRDFRRAPPSGDRNVTDWEAMSRALNDRILPRKPDLVLFAGFMCLYLLPPELEGRTMNIHPALIPAFCGQGMYGHHVHEAALRAGVKVSGCTVHFVTNAYDAGPIIVQRTCPVFDTDSVDTLAARVFEQECLAYKEAIGLFAAGRLRIGEGMVRIEAEGGMADWDGNAEDMA